MKHPPQAARNLVLTGNQEAFRLRLRVTKPAVFNEPQPYACPTRYDAGFNFLSALNNTHSRAIENFYVGINISGVVCQVPVPGLLGAFPRLHLDNGLAAIKISFHYFMGQVRICRGWATKSCLAHGIHLYKNFSMKNEPRIDLVKKQLPCHRANENRHLRPIRN
jgi:hypothetical protein